MKLVTAVVVAVLCWVVPAAGQGRMNQGQGGQGGPPVEQFRKLRMIEALKLDENTSVRFFAKYNAHEDAVRDINKNRNELLDQLQQLRKSDGSDADVGKVIDQLSDLDKQQASERARFFDDIRSVLSPKQVGDFLLFERNFARNVRQLMQEMARERRQGQRQPGN